MYPRRLGRFVLAVVGLSNCLRPQTILIQGVAVNTLVPPQQRPGWFPLLIGEAKEVIMSSWYAATLRPWDVRFWIRQVDWINACLPTKRRQERLSFLAWRNKYRSSIVCYKCKFAFVGCPGFGFGSGLVVL